MKDKKIIAITLEDFKRLDLKVRRNTKIKLENGYIQWVPKEYSINKIIDENLDFWKEHNLKGPLMLALHKKINDEEWEEIKPDLPLVRDIKDKEIVWNNIRFNYESFRIKYYNKVAEDFIYYPDYQNRNGSNKYNYHLWCSGEEIVIPKEEVDKIYLIDLNL